MILCSSLIRSLDHGSRDLHTVAVSRPPDPVSIIQHSATGMEYRNLCKDHIMAPTPIFIPEQRVHGRKQEVLGPNHRKLESTLYWYFHP